MYRLHAVSQCGLASHCGLADKDELANSGFLLLYETTNSWEVVPVEHILGLCYAHHSSLFLVQEVHGFPTRKGRFQQRQGQQAFLRELLCNDLVTVQRELVQV